MLAVEVSGITKRFNDILAVNRVSFDVRPGEIFGLLGPGDAGKTTTVRVVVTALPPDGGRAAIFGFDVVRERMAVRRLIGYVHQQPSADASLTAWDNVMLLARLYDLPSRKRAVTVADALELMGLADARNRLVSTYSGGMVRRLEVAQALINQPRLLVIDEPTRGLDPTARAEIWERVLGLRQEAGTTILLTTQYPEEADRLCDRVALVHHGEIRATGTPAELKEASELASSLQVGNHGEDPSMVVRSILQPKLAEDVADMGLHGPLAKE